jgi:hypothetical protein
MTTNAATHKPAQATLALSPERQAQRNLVLREQKEYLTLSFGTPLSHHPAGKIVVFGLPKSGNVWVVSLLADYTGLPPCHPIQDEATSGVGMCHLPAPVLPACRLDFLHGIYLVRDFRDLVVSYFYNGMTAWFRDDLPNYHYDTLEEFYFEWFLPRVVPYHDVHNHDDGFMRYGLPILRYEKLYDDPIREFTRLVKRLGLPYNDERVMFTVEKNRFEALKRTGVKLDRTVPPTHFRKGGYGGYRQELPRSVLRHINREFGNLLTRFGYELDEAM